MSAASTPHRPSSTPSPDARLGVVFLGALAACSAACSGAPGAEGPGASTSSSSAVTEVCGQPAGGPVQGVDVSDYQGNFDWSAAGVQFGYAQVSDGIGHLDRTFAANWANMKAAGVLRGAYQFFEPAEDVATQANLVVSAVGKLGAGDLPAMIDVEVTGGLPGGEIGARVQQWLEIVEAGTGLKPIIYTGSYFWEHNVGTNLSSYPIWIAAYGPACPSVPADGWSNWAFWQYSDGGGALDHDVFNGTLAQLQALSGGATRARPVPAYTAMAGDGTTAGYWIAGRDGGVFTYGNASFEGSMGGKALAAPVVGMSSTPSGKGYWLVASDGGVFTFGDAGYHGSMGGKPLNAAVMGIARTADGGGYWLAAEDGGIFSFGDAGFYGSMGGKPLNAPMVGIAATPDGKGYWMVGADGGVFSFGDAGFYGSMGGKPLNAPVVGIAGTPDGRGYWLVAADGGIFSFGDAGFHGSMGGKRLNAPMVGMAATPTGGGYWLIAGDGGIFTFGNARFEGARP